MTTPTMLVRLKPHNPKIGHVLATLTTPDGKKYVAETGWYEVSAALAEDLREYRQVQENPESLAAFDVCTYEEAKHLDRRATRAALPTAPADSPVRTHIAQRRRTAPTADTGDMTTSDMGRAPRITPEQQAKLDALDGGEESWETATETPAVEPPKPAKKATAAAAGKRATPKKNGTQAALPKAE